MDFMSYCLCLAGIFDIFELIRLIKVTPATHWFSEFSWAGPFLWPVSSTSSRMKGFVHIDLGEVTHTALSKTLDLLRC